ncbi:aminopeptidase, partial [Nostoc sp. HG1]|nr:aminopeptidase [Nostoc sp. HG1]
PGLLRSLIRQAGITVDEFLEKKIEFFQTFKYYFGCMPLAGT